MIRIVDVNSNDVAETEDVESARYALSILVAEERRDLRAIDERGEVVACGFYVSDDERVRISVVQGGPR